MSVCSKYVFKHILYYILIYNTLHQFYTSKIKICTFYLDNTLSL